MIAADDIISHAICKSYVLDYQEYKLKETIVYQDNKSEILLANNAKKYISKRINNINTRFLSPTASNKVNEKSSTVPPKTSLFKENCSSHSKIPS